MKKGIVLVDVMTFIIIFIFSLIIIFNLINYLKPFLIYQKLNDVIQKYIFVIERFGYLTDAEYNEMLSDIEKIGIDKEMLSIEVPKEKLNYGTLFKFRLSCYMEHTTLVFNTNLDKTIKKIPINIYRYGYIKC